MRTARVFSVLTVELFIITAGCQAPDKSPTITGASKTQHESKADQPMRAVLTAQNNPTTIANRGAPSLEDHFRPAAWVFIDDQAGDYVERDGNPLVQWHTKTPVSSSPTFRVEAYEPLLGTPKDFNCLLDTVESVDGSVIAYAIQADEGTFDVGRTYSLLKPGDNFVIRNRTTGDIVTEIGPLVSGTYLMVAGVKSVQTDSNGLTITQFAVEEGAGD